MEEAKTHNLKKPPASQAGKKQTGARQTANQPAQGSRISRRSSKLLTGQKPKTTTGARKDIKTPTSIREPYDLTPYEDIDDCYSVYKMNKHHQLTPFSKIMECPYDFNSPIYDYMQVIDRTEVESKSSRCKKELRSKE